MKQGKTLVELAQQIQGEKSTKRDFVASTERLEFIPDVTAESGVQAGAIEFRNNGDSHIVVPTNHCMRQIGEHCGIPAAYVERMSQKGHQGLLAQNVNHWFKAKPSNRMLRTLMPNGSGVARAFLSDRYRPLDNHDLAEVVLPAMQQAGCEVLSCEITETRLYIQAATPNMEARINEIRKKHGWVPGEHKFMPRVDGEDAVRAGVIVSNSEVGAGSLRVEPLLYFLWCLNGAISSQSIRRYHVGKRNVFSELESAAEYFTTATREADDRAFFLKVRDVINGVFDMTKFNSLVEKFAKTGAITLECGATKAVEEVTKRFQLTQGESESVLNHLVEGGELSAYGLLNAVTRASTDVESYDRAVELERIGGEIIELPPEAWRKLN